MPIPDHSCVPEKSLTASRRLLPTGASRPHAASKVIFHRSHAASMLSGAISTARVKQNRSLSHNDSTGMSKFSRTDHSCLPMSHSWHYLCESAVPRKLVSPNNTGNFGVKLGYAHSQPQLRSLENSNLHGAKAYCTLMPGWSDEQVSRTDHACQSKMLSILGMRIPWDTLTNLLPEFQQWLCSKGCFNCTPKYSWTDDDILNLIQHWSDMHGARVCQARHVVASCRSTNNFQ